MTPFVRGLVVRCGLVALPLVFVIFLCCVMSFLTAPKIHSMAGFRNAELTAQAGVLAPEDVERDALRSKEVAHRLTQAAFERLNITHARLNVPQ